MLTAVSSLVPWVLPPVLGAIIGYVTNSIAIKMLFRPYTEKRFLGIRVPFTPGIIPKQRYQLAESIARMVSRELLTEDTLLDQIRSEGFRVSIREQVTGITSTILDTKIADISVNRLGGEEAGYFLGLVGQAVRSDGFEDLVSALMKRAFAFLGDLSVSDLNPGRELLSDFISRILESVSSGHLHERAVSSIRSWLRSRIEAREEIGKYLTQAQVDWVCGIVDGIYDPLFGFLMRWLWKDSTRDQISFRAKFLLRDILDKLNLFQKLLVSAGQYDRTLADNMGNIVTDALRSLEMAGSDAGNRADIIGSIRRELEGLRKKRFDEVFTESGESAVSAVANALGGFFDFLNRESTREGIVRLFSDALEGASERKVADILGGILDPDGVAATAASVLVRKIREALDRRDVRPGHEGFVGEDGARTIRSYTGLYQDSEGEIADQAAGAIVGMLERKAPGFIEGIDIHGMVVNKINGLDVRSVEGLLLRVIEKHLRWINLFGAILGGIIGGLQIVLRVIGF